MTQQAKGGAVGGFKAKPNLTDARAKMKYKVSTTSTTASGVVPIRGATKYPEEPAIYFTREAWVKQCHLVRKCAKEVGWFALVDHDPEDNSFTITELVIPNQEVTSAETDIGKEDLADAAMELIEQGKDTSKMYAWFHSHVNMGVSPSSQDEYQVEDFLEDLADQPEVPAFIRGIQNKKGELKIDVYYVQHGVAYQNVNFYILYDDDPQWTKDIDTAITTKVKERTYTYSQYGSGGNRAATGKGGTVVTGGNSVGHGGGWAYDDSLRDYYGPNYWEDIDDEEDAVVSSGTWRPAEDDDDLPPAPTPVDITVKEISAMDVVYMSPDGVEVMLDTSGRLWVCDEHHEIFDYEDYTEFYGEINGDAFTRKLPAIIGD